MCHLIHKSRVCILNIFLPTPLLHPFVTFHLLSISKGSSLESGMVKNEFANIRVIYPVTDRREIQNPCFQFPLKSHRITAIHPIYYKFIAATSRLSLKGLLNFNWNEEVKTPSSFLKDKAMPFSGLGLHQTHATILRVSFQSINVLEQFSGSASNLSDKCKITQLGGKDCQVKT